MNNPPKPKSLMGTIRGLSSQQKQVDSTDLNQFKAGNALNSQLIKDYKRQQNNSASRAMFVSTGKELLKQAQKEKELEKIQGPNKNQISLESEVVALSYYQMPKTRDQTKDLIARQRESRRERHIKQYKEYEKWVERLTRNIDEAYKDIKRDVTQFFEESDIQINSYYESLTDVQLSKCEIIFLQDLNSIIKEHKDQRERKVSNLGKRLEDLEQEREKSLSFFCERLKEGLNDIAFLLMPEVDELVKQQSSTFSSIVEERRQSNRQYVEEVNQRQHNTFNKYEEMKNEKEQRWRSLKHEKYVKTFIETLSQWEYVNPKERVELYEEFQKIQQNIYIQRLQMIERMGKTEFGLLQKITIEKLQEEIKQFNEYASNQIDQCFEKLVEESEQTHKKTLNRYDELQKGLFYAGAFSREEIHKLLQEKYLPMVKKLNDDSRDLMKQAIKFIEASDYKQIDVLNNMTSFYLKLGMKVDEYKKEVQQLKHNYEIEKAQTADKNDERLEQLNDEFNQLKLRLSQSLHHPKLQEILEECFKKLDEIENQHRSFHESNQQIVKRHPDIITRSHENFERSIATIFELVNESQKGVLESERMKKLEADALKQLAKEEYLKRQEEEKIAEDFKNKKGGKGQAPKPKDPKKQAQELDDRLKEILKQLTTEAMVVVTSGLKQKFLESVSLKEIAKSKQQQMYLSQEELEKQQEEQKQAKLKQEQEEMEKVKQVDQKAKGPAPVASPIPDIPEYNPDDDVPLPQVDAIVQPPIDPQGNVILNKDVVIQISLLTQILQQTRKEMFEFIKQRLDNMQEESRQQDKEFLENSVHELDNTLKVHYPMKGKIEVEVMQVRSSQITIHKQRYERYAKTTIERVEYQTEQFNFFVEEGLNDMKSYEKDQKKMREGLPLANTLAKFQGMHNTVKENYFKFGEKINDLQTKLQQLTTGELDFLSQKNLDFIKESKLFENGGEYSQEEVDWYRDMIKELDSLIQRQRNKRQAKLDELIQILNTKRQENLDIFEKEYAQSVEELAAKEGTGQKYGRPKRLAQEKLRTEMTKCEKAQDAINSKIAQLKQMYDLFKKYEHDLEYFNLMNPSFSLQTRRTLMGLLTIIRRYSTHIEALKPDAKTLDIPRMTYNENKFDTILDPDQIDLDRKNIEEDLESMGPLFYQKDNRKFIDWVAEIEKIIKEEAQKTYVGDKAKYLTRADKIPDYLRTYIENMRRNMEDFKTQAIRDLRKSCEELSELVPSISEMLFGAILNKYIYILRSQADQIETQFNNERVSIEKQKEKHVFQLRPNLGNPQCKDEFTELCKREKQRLTTWMDKIKLYRRQLVETQFQSGQQFFKCSLQNFEFALIYYDCMVLFEDFVKLPGDEQIQKKHQSTKVSLRQKQSGIVIDTSSERSLNKEWPGVIITTFDTDDLKVEYVWSPNLPIQSEQPQTKETKKKDDKKSIKEDKKATKEQTQQDENTTLTRPLKSFKTKRQKTAYSCFNKVFSEFQTIYTQMLNEMNIKFKKYTEKEMKFEFKWEQSVKSLFQQN